MADRRRRAEPTTEWMLRDIAQRCRDVLTSLDEHDATASHLGNAAMLLRSAADDLVSVVELVEGGDVAENEVAPQAFGLSFGMDQAGGMDQPVSDDGSDG